MGSEIGNRTAVLNVIKSINKNAKSKISNESQFDSMAIPEVLKIDKQVNVSKFFLKKMVVDNYNLSEKDIDSAISDLQNDGILEVHAVDVNEGQEKINYLTYKDDAEIPSLDSLRNLFESKSNIV